MDKREWFRFYFPIDSINLLLHFKGAFGREIVSLWKKVLLFSKWKMQLKIGVAFVYEYKLELFRNFVSNLEWKKWKQFFGVLQIPKNSGIQLQVEISEFYGQKYFLEFKSRKK